MTNQNTCLVKKIGIVLIMMGPALYFGYKGESTIMGLSIVVSSFTIAFLNIDKFNKIKGAGIEAEFKKAVDDAYATLEQVREISKILLSSTIDTISYHNRWSGIPGTVKIESFNKIDKILKELNLNNDTYIIKAQSRRYYVGVLDALNKFLSQFLDKYGKSYNWDGVNKEIFNGEEKIDFPDENMFRKILRSNLIEKGSNSNQEVFVLEELELPMLDLWKEYITKKEYYYKHYKCNSLI